MLHVKIPNHVNIIYNNNKNLLICKNKTLYKLLNLEIKILIDLKKKHIIITNNLIQKISNNKKKKLNAFKGLIKFKIKQMFLELTIVYYQKLKFVGVGYRAIKINNKNEKNIFLLKLGLSHPLYLGANNNINIFCLKFTKLFIYGNSYNLLTQTTANIRLVKWPEPYKGKGILFYNEKIKLKVGKKI